MSRKIIHNVYKSRFPFKHCLFEFNVTICHTIFRAILFAPDHCNKNGVAIPYTFTSYHTLMGEMIFTKLTTSSK